MMNLSKLSICMITYNHEAFIAQAIESVLMQQTDFNYELVIGEDCSTDSTREIVVDYHKRYPDKIKLLLNENNLGAMQNFVQTIKACTGKYIALLEGDDYWTDPLKLQKQVDFLEANPEYSLCFHNAIIEYEDGSPNKLFANLEEREYSGYEVFDNWLAATNSWMFRNSFKMPDYFSKIIFGDIALLMTIAENGKLYCINDTMSVYRRHSSQTTNFYTKSMHIALIKQYELMSKFYKNKYDKIIRGRILNHAKNIIYGRSPTPTEIRYYLLKMVMWSPGIVFTKFFFTNFYVFYFKAFMRKFFTK